MILLRLRFIHQNREYISSFCLIRNGNWALGSTLDPATAKKDYTIASLRTMPKNPIEKKKVENFSTSYYQAHSLFFLAIKTTCITHHANHHPQFGAEGTQSQAADEWLRRFYVSRNSSSSGVDCLCATLFLDGTSPVTIYASWRCPAAPPQGSRQIHRGALKSPCRNCRKTKRRYGRTGYFRTEG